MPVNSRSSKRLKWRMTANSSSWLSSSSPLLSTSELRVEGGFRCDWLGWVTIHTDNRGHYLSLKVETLVCVEIFFVFAVLDLFLLRRKSRNENLPFWVDTFSSSFSCDCQAYLRLPRRFFCASTLIPLPISCDYVYN